MTGTKIQLKSDAIFDQIKDRLAENPAKGKQINAVFLYKITNTTSNGAPVKHWSKFLMVEETNTVIFIAYYIFMNGSTRFKKRSSI